MKMLNNLRPAFTFLIFALASSPVYAVSQQNNENTMEPVVLASAMTSNTNFSSGNAGASNLFLVFGASLIGISLVTRRLSV